MTLRPLPFRFALAAALPVASVLLVTPMPAHAAEAADVASARSLSPAVEPAVRLAQKEDEADKDRRKGRGGQPDDKADRKPQGKGGDDAARQRPPQQRDRQQGDPQKQQGDRARQDAPRQKQLQQQQGEERARQQKLQADQARQDALKQKQLQQEQAKDKAAQQKLQADKARQDALRQQQAREKAAREKAAREKAAEQKKPADRPMDTITKQRLEQAERERARQRKQDDWEDAAREKQKAGKPVDTITKQRLEQAEREKARKAQQEAQEKANRERLQADRARQDALKQKQLQEQQAQERAAREKREAEARERARKGQARPRTPPEFDRTKADREFEKAREEARRQDRDSRGGDKERWRDDSASKFEKLRRQRKERDLGSRRIIVEPDERVIVRSEDRTFIRHDESRRLKRVGRELRRERRKDGTLMVVTMGLAGALIYTLQDDHGRVLRRSRKGRDGREIVLFDDRRRYANYSAFGPGAVRDYDDYVDVPPPVVRIPREEYIVEYDRASPEELYETLTAPPVEPLERGYSLDEVRQSYSLLERMRRVDLDAINFEFGSWEVEANQYPKLERIARAMRRILDRAPDEVFLIEGHTDAVGSDIDNLSLSDRRAETVAVILSEEFGVPPENLTTQGYGEQHLKVFTEGPSRVNRRVSVRRITPLLSREGWDDEVR